MKPLENTYVVKLEEIRKKLSVIGCKESTFITVELLFFNALTVSTEMGDSPEGAGLQHALRRIQAEEYQTTKNHFKKSTQREKVIRGFIASFKKALGIAIKDLQSVKMLKLS
jgi:hypothetical protein